MEAPAPLKNQGFDYSKEPAIAVASSSRRSFGNLTIKTRLLLLVIVTFGPLGNVLLGKGMKKIGSANAWTFSDALPVLGHILSSVYLWLGIASLLTFFVAYLIVLTWADYSYVQPASAFSYAVVALLSYLLLGEVVSPLRLTGIGVICLGVLIVSRTSATTAGPRQ